jgi:CDP-glucose 4,6-dehydratase
MVIDAGFWRGRRVFRAGHAGFKGGWMELVMRSVGADVTGFSLAPEYRDGIFRAAQVLA